MESHHSSSSVLLFRRQVYNLLVGATPDKAGCGDRNRTGVRRLMRPSRETNALPAVEIEKADSGDRNARRILCAQGIAGFRRRKPHAAWPERSGGNRTGVRRLMRPSRETNALPAVESGGSDGTCTRHTLLARQHRPYGTCAPLCIELQSTTHGERGATRQTGTFAGVPCLLRPHILVSPWFVD